MGGAAAKMDAPTERVVYLAVSDLYELAIAAEWGKAIGASVVGAIPLERITPNFVVIPLVRDRDRTPVLSEEWDPGLRKWKRKTVPAKSLTGEVRECAPVRVAEFWTGAPSMAREDDFGAVLGGELDAASFINAITTSTIRYDVIGKTHVGEPNKLFLSWT